MSEAGTDDGKHGLGGRAAAAEPERRNETLVSRLFPGLRTLQGRFLAVNLPLVGLSMVLVLGLFGLYAHRAALHDLHDRMNKVAASQSGVLAESLWRLDHERIRLILNAIFVDEDVIGAVVFDELQKRIAAVGNVNAEDIPPEHIHPADIVFQTNEGAKRIGRLVIYHSAASVIRENNQRLIWGVILCVLLIAATMVSALVSNWRVIAVPLGRLRTAIALAEKSGAHATVDWRTRDEFGELVAAFNRMQAQQQRYESDLRAVREDLERRVEERTRELRMARDDAETANRAKTRFLQSMSHELRTPLNAILGFSDLIRMSEDMNVSNAQKREYAEDINRSALFLLDIVNDLLDLSRIEAEAHQPEDGRVDPIAAVNACLSMVRSAAQAKDIEIATALPEDAPFLVADERMIKQVFLNVLSNAVKFTGRGGRVDVGLRANDRGGLDFRFTDNGRGIAPEDMEAIFKPFNRIVNPLVSREEGTGLGLPLAKALVELHGGDFAIESQPNVGTTAIVTIPADRIRANPSAA